MKTISTTKAVGSILCHDLTKIEDGVNKYTAFRKGHIIQEEDIPVLLSMGKQNLYVWEINENAIHENEAAEILREISQGTNLSASEIKEGKITLKAEIDGLFISQTKLQNQINKLGDFCLSSRHSGFSVKKDEIVAGFKVIPLAISKDKMEKAKKIANSNIIFNVLPYKPLKAGIIATGSEVFSRRIKDKFTPVVEKKLSQFGITTVEKIVCDDKLSDISEAITLFIHNELNLIICTGGMSVDPDDLTPGAIKASGAKLITYGTPVIPGAMFLLGYNKNTTIIGLPGCVMLGKKTVFDIILPRIAAGLKISKEEILNLGNGGLCLECKTCLFPNCSFGKGHSYCL
jgi:hypothetical protein